MSGITTAISVLVSSIFVAALIKMIAPVGNTEKILRLVISLFVLICIAVSFESAFDSIKSAAGRIKLSEENRDSIKSAVESDVLKATGDYIADYMNDLISAEGVDAELVEVSIESDEKSVIIITDICIYIKQKDTDCKKRITEIVEDYIEITPEVIVVE